LANHRYQFQTLGLNFIKLSNGLSHVNNLLTIISRHP
jgi:hypothetical protein